MRGGSLIMPDEFSHVIIAFFIAEGMRLDKTWKKTVVIFGSVIPDIYKLLHLIQFIFKLPSATFRTLSWFFIPLSAISGSFVMLCIISLLFFRTDYRKEVFLFLFIGTISHLVADLFILHFSGGSKYFIPFSRFEISFNLVKSENYLMTIVSGVLAGIYLSIKRIYALKIYEGFKIKNDRK